MAKHTLATVQAADIASMNLSEMTALGEEIRKTLIETLSRTGGHLAPNLGVVELTLALYHTFQFPHDRIVWDVGHQSYVQKLLTGRAGRFDTMRQFGGISGFCRRWESDFDAFGAGHACTSISAALGFAKARDLAGTDERVIAVVGDGALTGGMAWEALNNAGAMKSDILVILNDNEMSIAPNVGALATYLAKIRMEPLYRHAESSVKAALHRIPMGDALTRTAEGLKHGLTHLVAPDASGVIFEEMGFNYLGPIDGHDLPLLVDILKFTRGLKGPVLLHVLTKKGKGFTPAEDDSVTFHGLGPFKISEGKLEASSSARTFTHAFVDAAIDLAQADPRVVAITAAMPTGTGLSKFAKAFPSRTFDVGIAEQHAVTFAGGLAAAGFRPLCAIYSTFLQRGYDQVVHDISIQRLPVTFCLDRGGIAGDDGATHQGVFDLSYLRCLPHMTVLAPRDGAELKLMLHAAVNLDRPIAIRYPRANVADGTREETGGAPLPLYESLPAPHPEEDHLFAPEPPPVRFLSQVLREGSDVAIFAVGAMVYAALQAADTLAERGILAAVVDARSVKPIDVQTLCDVGRITRRIITVEDAVLAGGYGSAVLESLNGVGLLGQIHVERMGIPDHFVEHGKRDLLLGKMGLNADGIVKRAVTFVQDGKQIWAAKTG
ncbi:MAG TPA: 1-deoxy-D-xylulose-5-phosphate synthase [Armatimonadota bacterium]|nr:1-deoxy-D-xylulose-5-phosphate synthase [Armatimonadota bacterium]